MKGTLLIICGSIIVLTLSYTRAGKGGIKPTNSAPGGIDTLAYKTTIQPILQKKCSPCHFPGGKMYEQMPFDKGETIISHAAGALKRFKDKREIGLITQFIENNKVK